MDQYIWGIITTVGNNNVDEVTMDSMAWWRVTSTGGPNGNIKEEGGEDSCKRWNKAMSPSSMTLPTTNNFDLGQSLSPYVPPDMNSKCISL